MHAVSYDCEVRGRKDACKQDDGPGTVQWRKDKIVLVKFEL